MTKQELQARTKQFALRVVRLIQALPNDKVGDVLRRQLLRSGTSVGANYRAACRAKSPADFLNKLKIVEEEADESLYWLELVSDAGLVPPPRLADLEKEADALVAIFVAAARTTRTRSASRPS